MASVRTTVYVGTVNGKKIRKTVTAPNKRELDRKVMALKLEVAAGKDCYSKATFSVWAQKWLDEVVEPKGLATGTVRKYTSAVSQLNKTFGNRELRDIRLSEFQQLLNALAIHNPTTGSPTAKATLANLRMVADCVFRYARQNNIEGVPDFFGAVVLPAGAPTAKRRALSLSELSAVRNTLHYAQPLAMVMLFCGLRIGECVALRWQDVDLARGVLRVVRSADLQGNTAVLKAGGKTPAARRLVPMPVVLTRYLGWYREARADGTFFRAVSRGSSRSPAPSYRYPACKPVPTGPTDLLFTTLQGKMFSKSSLRRLWEDYMAVLGEEIAYSHSEMPYFGASPSRPHSKGSSSTLIDPALCSATSAPPANFTAHNLRHTYATMLFLQGVDVGDAMQYMGHASYQVTMDIYTDTEQYCRFDLDPALRKCLRTDFKIPKVEL